MTDTDNRPLSRERYAPPADEISLADLFAALYRQRWLIGAVFLGTVLIAVAWVILRPVQYEYRTAIEIGSYIKRGAEGEQRELVQSVARTKRQLQKAWIPQARTRFAEADDGPVPKIEVDAQESSGLLVLRSAVSPARAEAVHTIHEAVVDRFEANHERRLRVVSQRAAAHLESARQRLAFLEREAVHAARVEPLENEAAQHERALEALGARHAAQRLALENEIKAERLRMEQIAKETEFLHARLDSLEEIEARIEQQREQAQVLLGRMEQEWLAATPEPNAGSSSDVMFLLGGQINEARERVAQLTEQLRINIPAQREEWINAIADNERERVQIDNRIAELDQQLDQIQAKSQRERAAAEGRLQAARTDLALEQAAYESDLATQQREVLQAEIGQTEIMPSKTLFVAMRSITPVSPGLALVAALAGILGLMLGIFAALVRSAMVGITREDASASTGLPDSRSSDVGLVANGTR